MRATKTGAIREAKHETRRDFVSCRGRLLLRPSGNLGRVGFPHYLYFHAGGAGRTHRFGGRQAMIGQILGIVAGLMWVFILLGLGVFGVMPDKERKK